MLTNLWLYLAAIAVGFGLIGLSSLIPLPSLSLILFIVGVIVVIVFSMTVVYQALRTLFGRQSN